MRVLLIFISEYLHQRRFSARRTAFSIARAVAFHKTPF